jgi:translation initiation factor 2D
MCFCDFRYFFSCVFYFTTTNANSDTVSPISGKGPNAGLEVLVQGKQIKAVVDLLLAKGVPKKWIETLDLTAEKK